MSHEITIKNGVAEMAYVGDEPWHGLGQKLEAGASIDEWKIAAGMNWNINRSRVRYGEGDSTRIFDKHHVLFRSDTKEPLSVVGKDYKIIQPGEVLEFFRDLTEGAGFQLDTAGTLFGGRKFWALAKIGETAVVAGDDKVDGYLLLATSCDGTMRTQAKFVATRVVCNNTLTIAVNHERGKKVVHTSHRSNFNANAVKDQLGIARDSFANFMREARQLSKVTMTEKKAQEFIDQLLKDTKYVTAEDVSKSRPSMKIMDLYRGSAMGGLLLGAEGSAWGVVNAVTEFIDHHAKAKSASHLVESSLLGRGDQLKTEAYIRAASLV